MKWLLISLLLGIPLFSQENKDYNWKYVRKATLAQINSEQIFISKWVLFYKHKVICSIERQESQNNKDELWGVWIPHGTYELETFDDLGAAKKWAECHLFLPSSKKIVPSIEPLIYHAETKDVCLVLAKGDNYEYAKVVPCK